MTKHWDKEWSGFQPAVIDLKKVFYNSPDPCDEDFLKLIGLVSGKNVLDLGCGNGELAVYLAKLGAKVTAVDASSQAINNTKLLAENNNVQIQTQQIDVFEIENLQEIFDLVVGRFILHHIEPFPKFIKVLDKILKPGGRGVFLENNARNKLLLFFRKNLVGRFGVPKHSDDQEYPLEPKEIEILKSIGKVSVYYPKLMLITLMGVYLTPRNFMIRTFLRKVDDFIYPILPFLGKYSYRQLIEIKKV